MPVETARTFNKAYFEILIAIVAQPKRNIGDTDFICVTVTISAHSECNKRGSDAVN